MSFRIEDNSGVSLEGHDVIQTFDVGSSGSMGDNFAALETDQTNDDEFSSQSGDVGGLSVSQWITICICIVLVICIGIGILWWIKRKNKKYGGYSDKDPEVEMDDRHDSEAKDGNQAQHTSLNLAPGPRQMIKVKSYDDD
eukprot:TRINITY_DN2289_c0_g2_i1.p1 TRINITY_DN2289_c0_g2~~TRINITY_DN2289_c0_g2_i1.p1  ORF type:complete len:140 (-),score=29.85 TRINITY_DN2289_c0_g2_i1:112-531(-)